MRSRPAWRQTIQRDEQRCRSTAEHGQQQCLSEVGVGINEDLKLAEHADQKITEISVNDRAQVGAAAFGQIARDIV